MDQRSALRETVLAALLAPAREICDRPLTALLARNGHSYRLPADHLLPPVFTEPATSQYFLTLLVLYVDKVAACVRLDADNGRLEIDETAAAALPLKETALPNTLRNVRRLSGALASEHGRQLLAAMLLSCKRPDLSDDRVLYQEIISQVVVRGLDQGRKT